MRITKSTTRRVLGISLAAFLVIAGTVVTAGNSQAAAVALKISVATGPSAGGLVVSVTGAIFKDGSGSLIRTNANGVQFQSATTCSSAPDTPTSGSPTSVVNATKSIFTAKLTVTTPALDLGTSNAAKAYKLCVYDTDGSGALFGSVTFTVYPRPTVTSISPSAGSSLGGGTVTVVGTGFTAKTTAKVGGTALTGVKIVSASKLTGVLPAHAAQENVNVAATSEGGTNVANTLFDYKNAITVAPSFAKSGSGDSIEITGVGFDALDFGSSGHATVGFVVGAYDAGSGGTKVNDFVDECENIAVVDDSTITCDVPSSGLTAGAYTVTVLDESRATDDTGPPVVEAPTFQTVVSSGATLTVATF
jgi:hypothetical protein